MAPVKDAGSLSTLLFVSATLLLVAGCVGAEGAQPVEAAQTSHEVTGLSATLAAHPAPRDPAPMVIHLDGRDWQEVIDAAPPFATIIGDGREVLIREEGTIRVTRPLRIVKFQGRLEDGLGRTPILKVESEGVVVEDFRLFGNHGTVEYSERATLLLITAGHFIVQNGHVENATKHGIEVAAGLEEGHVEGGIIRDIIGRGVRRDVISINGKGNLGRFNRNILVENITAYGSEERGAVEVVDGTYNVTVRNVRCDLCRYGVDVQDHRAEGQINTHVLIDGVHVTRTPSAIITANEGLGHSHLTLRNISGEEWPEPTTRRGRFRGRIDVSNTDHVLIENVRIVGDAQGHAIALHNAGSVVLRDIFVEDHTAAEAVIDLDEVGGLVVDRVIMSGASGPTPLLLDYRRSEDGPAGGGVIRGVLAVTGNEPRLRIADRQGTAGDAHSAAVRVSEDVAGVRIERTTAAEGTEPDDR